MTFNQLKLLINKYYEYEYFEKKVNYWEDAPDEYKKGWEKQFLPQEFDDVIKQFPKAFPPKPPKNVRIVNA